MNICREILEAFSRNNQQDATL